MSEQHFSLSKTTSCVRKTFSRLAALAIVLTLAGSSHGATLSWSGAGTSGYWSDGANWGYAGAPLSGDTLVFPAGVARLTNTNNISGLTLNQIRFAGSAGGYDIYGIGITLTNGIQATNTSGGNAFLPAITLATTDVTVNVESGATLTLGGVLSGNVGVTKTGGGTLNYYANGSNSCSGTTRVNAGTLTLRANANNGAFGGPLVIGDGSGSGSPTVRLIWDTEIPDNVPITINRGGLLDLNNLAETIGSLTLAGGTVSSGTATLTMNSNLTVLASSVTATINGNLKFTNGLRTITVEDGTVLYDLNLYANITDDGGGLLITNSTPVANFVRLLGSNSFTGPLTIANVRVSAENPWSLGATNGGTTVRGNTALWLYQTGVTNEALTLDDGALLVGQNSNTWSGPVTLNGGATIQVYPVGYTLNLIGSISGTGGFTKSDLGSLMLSGTSDNLYTGPTLVLDGYLLMNKTSPYWAIGHGSLTVGNGIGAAGSTVARELGPYQMGAIPVTVNSDGLLDLNNFDDTIGTSLTLNGGGDVQTGTGTLTLGANSVVVVDASTNSSSISGKLNVGTGTCTFDVYTGYISVPAWVGGSANVVKTGGGSMFLDASNSFTGILTIDESYLNLSDSWAAGSSSAGTIVTNSGTLGFSGSILVGAEPLTLNRSSVGQAVWNAGGSNSWSGPVTLSHDSTVYVLTNTFLNLSGVIGGTSSLTKGGSGTLIFSGSSANTYLNSTYVNNGVLALAKTSGNAIRGQLFIGDGFGGAEADIVRFLANDQIDAGAVTVNSSGLLDLNGYSDSVGNITLNGSRITTGAGTLLLYNDVTANAHTSQVARIDGKLLINNTRTFTVAGHQLTPDLQINAYVYGNGLLVKAGNGELSLTSSNSYTGATWVNDGTLLVDHSWALGDTAQGTTVSSNATLSLRSDSRVGDEGLLLNSTASPALQSLMGSNSWAGAVSLGRNSAIWIRTNDWLNFSGVISGSGNLEKSGPGTLLFSGSSANSYAGATFVNAGTLSLARTGTDRAIPGDLAILGTVRLLNSNQITNSGNVTINSSGTLQINGYWDYIDGLSGAGSLDLSSGGLYVGASSASSTFAGVISGAGSFYKMGAGTLTLTGTNTLTGPTGVAEGPALINGFQPQSPVTVYAPGSLGGTGVIGSVIAYGYILPGASPGILTCSNLTFTSAGDYFVELTGPTPGRDYDQLNVRGTNNLGSAALHVATAFTTPVPNGHKFVIINNDGTDPITGIFLGWPEGTTLNANGFKLVISYSGGDGNDVVFTVTDVPAGTAGSTVSAGNGNHVIDPNECNNLDVVITNKTATPMTGVSAVLSTTTPGVVVNQPYSDYPNVPGNANATNNAPFQISTLPSFTNYAAINLQLTIASSSHGAFTMPLSLATGGAAGGGYCDSCLPALTGSITTNDQVQVNRIVRNHVLASCGSPKPWPGGVGGSFHYDVYTFTNLTTAEACVTVELTGCDLQAGTYLNSFNPSNISSNYLGDAGWSTGPGGDGLNGPTTFSCIVPAGARFQVAVNEVTSGEGCTSYTLQLSGLPCPQPTLAINAVPGTNRVRIHWPTWAGGYELEATLALVPTNWTWITNEPIVSGGRLNVTNAATSPTNRFYRLHKP